ncbi:MAG: hypothetical protein DRJ52_04705, partial [Thermoprotei archaeon]
AVFSHGFIVSSILALILEVMLLSFLDVVTVVPVIEELAKFFGVFLASRWRRVFNEIDDGIVYGASSGLGFATLESILYSMKGHFLTIGTLRAFSSTLSHATASALFGYYYAVSLFTRRHFFTVIGFLAAIALHALHNFLIVTGLGLLTIPVDILAFVLVVKKLK